MKKVSFFLSLLVSVSFLFQQCKKEPGVDQNVSNYEHFSIIDGRIAFHSQADYDAVKLKLASEQDKIAAWEASLSNYTSMRTAYADMTDERASELLNHLDDYKYLFTKVQEESGEFSMERNVDNDVMATLINKDGLLQIGDDVYRFTRDRFFKTDVKNLDRLMTNSIDLQDKKVAAFDVKRTTMMSDMQVSEERAVTWAECTNTSGSFRVKGIIEVEDLIDNDCNMITKHQKKVLGVWFANSTSMSVSFSGNFVKIWSNCNPAPISFFSGMTSSGNSSSISLMVMGNHPIFQGCNGSAAPFHDGLFISTYTAGGKTCSLTCPQGVPCM
jgi:hypothetical protein